MLLQGSSQRLDVMSESDAGSQYSQFSQGVASPVSTPNIAKRKSVNDRSVEKLQVMTVSGCSFQEVETEVRCG